MMLFERFMIVDLRDELYNHGTFKDHHVDRL